MFLLQTNAQQAETILENGVAAQQAVGETMDNLWDLTLNSPLYSEVAQIGSWFAYGTIAIFIYEWIKIANEEDRGNQPGEKWVFVAVIVTLLTDEGSLLKDLTFAMRYMLNHLSEQVLSSTLEGSQSLIEAFNQVSAGMGIQGWYDQAIQLCYQMTDPEAQQTCIEEAQTTASQLEARIDPSSSETSLIDQITQGVGGLLVSQLETVLIGWLLATGIAIQWLVEITWILTGLAGPIAVGGSLLPVKQKAIFAWLIGFYSIGLYKLFYNILVGMIAMVQISAGSLNALIFALATGLLSPILAAALTVGGGWATFTSLASVTAAVAGKAGLAVGGKAMGMGVGAAKGGARIVTHPIGRGAGQIYQNRVSPNIRRRIRTMGRDATTPLRPWKR